MYLEFIIIYNFVSNLNLGNKFKFELTSVRVICLVYFCSQLEYNFLEDRDREREYQRVSHDSWLYRISNNL